MTEQELRDLVRRVVSERLAGAAHASSTHAVPEPVPLVDGRTHASHAMLRVPAGSEMGGSCVIEPDVGCGHCGYCKSLGH